MPTIDIRGQSGAGRGGSGPFSAIEKAALKQEELRKEGPRLRAIQRMENEKKLAEQSVKATMQEVGIKRKFLRDEYTNNQKILRERLSNISSQANRNTGALNKQIDVTNKADKKRQDDAKRAAYNNMYAEAKAENEKINSAARAEKKRIKEEKDAQTARESEAAKADKQRHRELIRDSGLGRIETIRRAERENAAGNSVYFTDIDKAEAEKAKREAAAARVPGAPRSGKRGGGGPPDDRKWYQLFKRDDGRPAIKNNASDILAEELTGSALIGVLGKAGKIIAGLSAAAVESPLIPGQMMRGILALAGPEIKLQKSTYAMGRAGGFSGERLESIMKAGGGHWMDELFLTPEKMMESLGQYGIVPHSVADATVKADLFARQSLQPGFSGMAQGTVEGAARQVAGYSGPSSVSSYVANLGATLEQANAKGMDRSKVLGNIQDAMDKLVASGAAGVSTTGILDMVARFAATGTAGGRTGQSAANMLSGLSGIANAPAGNAPAMFMMYSQMGKYGGLKTIEDLKNFVGPEAFSSVPASVRSKAVSDILAASAAGNTYAAMNIASGVFLSGNPGRVGELIQPGLKKSLPGYLQSAALAGITGTSLGESYAYGIGAGTKAPTGIEFPKVTGTPADIGRYENQESQQTLAGASTELTFFTKIVSASSAELEKFYQNLSHVNNFYDTLHEKQPDRTEFWRQFGHNAHTMFDNIFSNSQGVDPNPGAFSGKQ